MHLAGQQHLGQLVADRLLHQATQRAGAVDGIEAAFGQPFLSRQRDLQFQATLCQPLLQLLQLDVDDPDEFLLIQRIEDQHVIETIDELRLELGAHRRHHLLLVAA